METRAVTPTIEHSGFNRFVQIGDVARTLAQGIRRTLLIMGAVLGAALAYLVFSGARGAVGFALIAGGSLLALAVWRNGARGLPLLPLLVAQHLIAFGLPILSGHPMLERYPEDYITQAGLEVFIFCATLTATWRSGMNMFRPSPPVCYALQGFAKEGMAKVARLGFLLVVSSTAYQVLGAARLTEWLFAILPSGSASIINTVLAAVGMCGFFLLAMLTGATEIGPVARGVFWLLLTLSCLISAASFLLSAAGATLGSVMIGLMWSRGRIPWRFILVVAALFAFFNIGKFEMRERYWFDEDRPAPLTLADAPRTYLEWSEASFDLLTGANPQPVSLKAASKADDEETGGQHLINRINNLQNLLFAMDAVDTMNIPPLGGGSYTIIPKLLIPRILWPEKPRTHEGQVMLNVHFGRQDLTSTFHTYVAWGVLAEAYGNFGAYTGSFILGAVLGLFCAWVENATARKLVLSLEGFLSFSLFVGMANSFEMVASVLVTSIFQSFVPIFLACWPFVERQRVNQPSPDA